MLDLYTTLVSGGALGERRATAGRLLFETLGIAVDAPHGGNLRDHFSAPNKSRYVSGGGQEVWTWPKTDFTPRDYTEISSEAANFICSDQDGETIDSFESTLSQIMGNAAQHSKSESAVFAAIRTQHYASFVVMDKGVGISSTFSKALKRLGNRYSDKEKAEIALRWAMMECISSGNDTSSNRGRGLPLLKAACSSSFIYSDGVFCCNQKGGSFFPRDYWSAIKGRKDFSGSVNCQNSQDLKDIGVVVEAYIDLRKIGSALKGFEFDCQKVHDAFQREYGPAATEYFFGS